MGKAHSLIPTDRSCTRASTDESRGIGVRIARKGRRLKTLLPLCLAAFACSQEMDAAGRGRAAPADLVLANGEQLNGEQLNGEQLNGEQLNGEQLNGPGMAVNVASTSFGGAVLGNGTPLDSTSLDGTMFHGSSAGNEFAGADFTLARFHAVAFDGSPVELRIASIAQKAPPDDDVWTYQVDFQDANGASWSPLCRDASGAAVPAIPLAGRWNYGRGVAGGGAHVDDPAVFTFACEGLGAVAKCVSPLGYKPWKTVNGVSLAPYHQACVRMIRADYCGNGTSWTQDGRLIDVYDGLGIQEVSQPLWPFEAEWNEAGAVCLSNERANDLHDLFDTIQSCIPSKLSLTCGITDHFHNATRMMNRFSLPKLP
jgi:hypothetical protein